MESSAAEALINQLSSFGADRVFCVPGESYLAALDAMYEHPNIEVVSCRHEGGAGFMALADARLTQRPGVIFTSRGPGSMNAAIALHAAQQDGVPLLVFIGHVTRQESDRNSFQEVDYRRTFSDIAKAVFEIHEGSRVVDTVSRAWHLATSGAPGPVVIVLPEDMLQDRVSAQVIPPAVSRRPAPASAELDIIHRRLAAAKRPLLLAGGQINTEKARTALQQVAERWDLPVLGTFKQQDVMDNGHCNWVGQIGFTMPATVADSLQQADLIVAVGTRLGDITTQGYTFPKAPVPDQDVIQVYPSADDIGRNTTPYLGVVADSECFLTALASRPAPPPPAGRHEWVAQLKDNYRSLSIYTPKPSQSGVDFGGVVEAVNRHCRPDTIFCLDSGNFATWVHRYLSIQPGQRLLGSASGAMGSGVPYAVAAGLRHTDRMVVTFMGDGGALMTCNELATAVHYGANIKIIIADNSLYGTIRGFQEKFFPGRPVGTSLTSPDFAAWAEAFGVRGWTIDDDSQTEDIVQQALNHPGSAVIHVKQSPERLNAFSP
ncbi:thiamine pyrophosphate-dependent enzyme [Halomonas sp. V046]|uniref:thiamine pyrophosphate-dependent enzyme n=1 Tax=Halomonas sp. V046 TaxID=3459611 RepID=UPI00404398A9